MLILVGLGLVVLIDRQVMNPSTNRKTHCGVQEFIAEDSAEHAHA